MAHFQALLQSHQASQANAAPTANNADDERIRILYRMFSQVQQNNMNTMMLQMFEDILRRKS
jgi:hypothetical protein